MTHFLWNGSSGIFLLGLFGALAAFAEQVEMRYGGSLQLEQTRLKVTPVAFKAPGWAMFEGVAGRDGEDFSFRFANPDAVDVSGGLTLATQATNAVKFAYSFKPLKAVELSSLGLYATFPIDDYVGATVCLDDRQVEVPAVAPFHPTGELVSGRCQAVSVRRRDGRRLSFRFDGLVGVRVRDQRRTRGYGNLVVWIELPHAQHYEADRVLSLAGTLTCSDAIGVTGKPSPVKIAAGTDWIPVDFKADVQPGSAMDFSSSRGTDSPAGRQGRVIAKGPHFAFANSPDVSRRFYGVNLCNYANFPETPEDARRLAARLSRCGYNSVRFHHYDWPMVSKSIDGLAVNREMQRRFDSLVAACVEYGLYMTTDFYVSRWITLPSVGRKKSALMPNGDFKSLVYVDEAVFANYMSFTRELLTHVNPYTKRRLCDEPALAAICLINEGNHGNDMGRYGRLPEWRTAWQDWIAREKSGHPEWAEVSTNIPSSCVDGSAAARAFSSFLADREKAFVARMRKFLREELKCGVPITNMNFGYGVHPEEFREVRAKDYDYVDEHYYFDHPLRVFAGRSLPTSVSSGENPLRGGAKLAVNLGDRQVPDRPYTVTEFNWCWSGQYRSACGPAVAARAVERNWAGLWRFDWSDDLGGVTNAAAKHLGPFDIAVDPLAQCSDRAAVNLYLRGDLFDPSARVDFDRNRGALRVATPKTAVVSAPGGAIRAGALSAGLRGGFATVWATATDDRPLAESGRILLAHLTDVQNEGDEFADVSQSILLTRGGSRRLMRAGKAEVSLKVADGDWRVWALSMSGRRQRLVPSTRANGCVRFVADVAARPESATFLYELVRREGAKGSLVRPFENRERVVFLGDSITHLGRYLGYLQLFQVLRHPGSDVRIINGGIAGDVAGGGLKRLERDVFDWTADRAFVMFGMNDIGRHNYAATNPTPAQTKGRADALKRYDSNMRGIVDALMSRKVETVLMTPTPYDQYTDGKGECLKSCNESGLAAAADIVRSIAIEKGVGLVELFKPLTAIQKDHLDFKFCPDRVHPGNEGGLLMAASVLAAMSESPVVASVELDGRRATTIRATVTNVVFAGSAVSFDYLPEALPFPALPEYSTDERFYPLTDRLNQEIIRVCGLDEGYYSLMFDGCEVGVFPADEFCRGVNVAILDTPGQRLAKSAAKPMYELVALTEKLRDYEIAAKWVRERGKDPMDAEKADACLEAFLKSQEKTPYIGTFRHWVANYRDVRVRKYEYEENAEALYHEMARIRPTMSRVTINGAVKR